MTVRAIDFVVVHVADMNRAVEFYRDTLGVPVNADDIHEVWTELDTHPVTVALFRNPDSAGSNASIALAVDDVAAAVESFRAAGHKVVLEPLDTPDCHMAAVHDLNGNTLILHHRKDGTAG
jgi:predicted enzyme related to lactoylglutathione lyase